MSGSGAHSHYLWLSLWCGFPSQPLLAVDFMGKDSEQLILLSAREGEFTRFASVRRELSIGQVLLSHFPIEIRNILYKSL